jgi:hypothetical protein
MVENNISRDSFIDPDWKVYFTSSIDADYPAELFAQYGIAVAIINYQIIIIDSDQTSDLSHDHILAIEAHEISHGRLNHGNRKIDQNLQEKEADWLAHSILTSMNQVTSADLIYERYMLHYRQPISSLDEHMDLVLSELALK